MTGLMLLPLDGTDTIGGTKLLLQLGDSSVLLDFGTNFSRMNTYYEEYLRPRSTMGLLDHVVMGTLPDARGIYRQDLVHPDLELKGPEVWGIAGVLLSHAHVDHSGDIGFLRPDIPVATSPMSAAIVKASQDSGRAEVGRDCVYCTPRILEDKRRSKILKSSREDAVGREFAVGREGRSKDFEEFWSLSPSELMSTRGRPRKTNMGLLTDGIPGIRYRRFPVDHSMKGAAAYAIDTPTGTVVYTGDLRVHGLRGDLTKRFMEEARSPRPHVMIIEGTRVREDEFSEGEDSSVSERDVLENVKPMIDGMTGDTVIADFGPRNIERLEIFLGAAKECHRRLVVTTKDAYLLHAMHSVDPSVPTPGDDMLVYDSPKGSEGKFEEWVLELGYPGASVLPQDIRTAPGDYLLCFSFFDMKHLIDLRPSSGHYIYSSSEAHSEDQEIDFIRLGNWLSRFDMRPYGFSFEEGRPVFTGEDGALHASGHAAPSDLVDIIESVDPEMLIPVHTEHRKWFVSAFGGQRKVILPERMTPIGL
jgi:ribonuclease J